MRPCPSPCWRGADGRAHCQQGSGIDSGGATRSYVDWLMATRTMSEHTCRAYDSDLASLREQPGSSTPVTRLSADTLVDFITAQRDRGLAAATIQRRASALVVVGNGRVLSGNKYGVG